MRLRFIPAIILSLFWLLVSCSKDSLPDPVQLTGSRYEGSIATGRGGENKIRIEFEDAEHFRFTQEFVDPESGQVYPLYDNGTWSRDQTGLRVTLHAQGRTDEATLTPDGLSLSGIWNEAEFRATRLR